MHSRTSSHRNIVLTLILGLAASLLIPTFAFAASASIAVSSDNQWGWAVSKTQEEANRKALKLCTQVSKKKDCKLSLHKAVVQFTDGTKTTFAWSEISLKHAKEMAKKGCGETACKVSQEITEPGFFSIAQSKEGGGEKTHFLAYGYNDSDIADKDARAGCEKRSKAACTTVISSAIPGVIKAKASTPPVANSKNCRPNTATLTCSSQCTNGNCVVTYENGCKMRVQVSPKFDPFNNQWTYPTPSC